MMYSVVFLGFMLFFVTMAIGVMMGRKPLAGSCGGLAQVGLDGECKVCGKTPGSCDITGENNESNGPTVKTIDAGAPKSAVPTPAKVVSLADRINRGRFKDPLDF